MPVCPKHGTEMIRCNQGTEIRGSGWNAHKAYFEEFICPECKFRLRAYYLIVDIGR